MSSRQGEAAALDLEGLAWTATDRIEVSGAFTGLSHPPPATPRLVADSVLFELDPATALDVRGGDGNDSRAAAPKRLHLESGDLQAEHARHAHLDVDEAAQAGVAVQPAPAQSARAEGERLENRFAPIREALDDRM
jgi:hypothetical protein